MKPIHDHKIKLPTQKQGNDLYSTNHSPETKALQSHADEKLELIATSEFFKSERDFTWG